MHGNHQNWKGNKGVPRGAPRATHGGCLATPASTALFLPFASPSLSFPIPIPLFTASCSLLRLPLPLLRSLEPWNTPSSPDPSSVFLHPRFLPPVPAFPVLSKYQCPPPLLLLSTLRHAVLLHHHHRHRVHPLLFFFSSVVSFSP